MGEANPTDAGAAHAPSFEVKMKMFINNFAIGSGSLTTHGHPHRCRLISAYCLEYDVGGRLLLAGW